MIPLTEIWFRNGRILMFRLREMARTTWVAIILMTTLVLLGGCISIRAAESSDPRAYAGSAGEASLETVLSDLRFSLKACMLKHVRYFVGYYPEDLAYIKFDVKDGACVQHFLKDNLSDMYFNYPNHHDDKDSESAFYMPGLSETLRSAGWPLDKVLAYDEYSCQDRRLGRGYCVMSVIPGDVTQVFVVASYSVQR